MKNLRKSRRVQILSVSAVVLILATALIGYGMRDGIQFFRTPTQALADVPEPAEVFRLGGMVEADSLTRDGTAISFRLTDGEQSVTVAYTGMLPDLFAEGQGAIASGRFIDGQFHATEILAKHDEEYMPRELMQMAEN